MKMNVHVIISGRVQGVWFRATTKQIAEQLGIKGWVRNTSDGCVEAILEGEEQQVKKMIEWCHRGPPLAVVNKVEVKNQNPTDSSDGFSIKY
jgi:acylphosphatase